MRRFPLWVLLVVPVLVLMPSASAFADSLTPSPSDFAINVPGSVLSGAAKGVGVYTEAQVGAVLANKVKYAWDWSTDAIASRLSGNSSATPPPTSGLSPAEVSRLDQIQAGMKGVPSTVFKTTTKVVGGAVTAFFVAQSGLALGPVIDSAFGLDDTAALCGGGDASSVAHMIAGVTGLDCDKWAMSQQLQTLMNKDANGGVTVGAWACDGTFCAKYAGLGYKSYADTACFLTKGTFPPNSYLHWRYADTTATGTRDDNNTGPANMGYYMCGNMAADYSAYWWGGAIAAGRSVGSYWIEDGSTGAVTPIAAVTTSSADPVRQFRCDVTSTTGAVLSQLSPQFTESGQQAKPVCPAIPVGWVPAETHQWQVVAGQPDIDMGIVPTTPEYQNWKTTYPECANGSCLLDLKKAGVSCLSVPGPCADWMTDPARDTNYQCHYGTHDIALSECYVYGSTFDPAKVATGHAYADPATGKTPSEATSLPAGDPGVGSKGEPCFPTGWGVVNPVEWVMKPIGCALRAAFTPDPAVIQEVEANSKKGWDESTPGQIARDIAISIDGMGVVDSGCSGILINFPTWNATGNYSTTPEHVLAACPGDYFAKWAPLFSVFIGGGFAIVGLLGAKRLVSALFGFHDPGVTV